ncbi:MAG: ATP-binding protein [Proteobacteria bacterium]|nr:ATP-binding protein [Pseudomonadota bacterium]
MRHFPRRTLAQQIARALQGNQIFSDAHNGLFLAAPRRTGKSTFLQEDLEPELERLGMVIVYVDLWADQRRDPGDLIADAIGRELAKHLGPIAKAAKAAGLQGVNVASALQIDTSRIGRMDGITLTDAVRVLHETAKAPVVLIIDEAQHALTSEAGETVMAALKSARDQLNAPGKVNLMLVMSGSDRDKLLRLVNSNSAPFYGSQIQKMPELDRAFIDFVSDLVERQRPDLRPVDRAMLDEAFAGFGRRPQFFMTALGEALSPLSSQEGRFEAAVIAAAEQRQRDDEAQMESEFLALKPLERAVLWRLLAQGDRFRPYDAEALRFYSEKTGVRVTTAKAQTALESLRQHNPSMVWKSARSAYAVEDAAMHRWYEKRMAAGAWPPTDSTE